MNKYSNKKVVWFPNKLFSLKKNSISAPIYVRIKPINACNHRCWWCVYHESSLSQMHTNMNNRSVIPFQKMLSILEDFKLLGVKAVTYSGGGEPLMYPYIIETVKQNIKDKLDFSVITNGQFLAGEIAELFCKAKWVRISMDYSTEKEFILSRRVNGDKYYEILSNIRNFASLKSSDCDLSVNFIVTRDNYKSLKEAAKLLVGLGVENIRFSPLWCPDIFVYHYDIKDEVQDSINFIKDQYKDEEIEIYSSYNDTNISTKSSIRPYNKCYMNQVVPVIGADLNVYTCHNQAYSNDSIICSLKDKSFIRAWYSDEAKAFFDSFDCKKVCVNQCSNESKNLFISELLECSEDNFV